MDSALTAKLIHVGHACDIVHQADQWRQRDALLTSLSPECSSFLVLDMKNLTTPSPLDISTFEHLDIFNGVILTI